MDRVEHTKRNRLDDLDVAQKGVSRAWYEWRVLIDFVRKEIKQPDEKESKNCNRQRESNGIRPKTN